MISGPVSFVVRGSEPSRSVVTESLVPVSSSEGSLATAS